MAKVKKLFGQLAVELGFCKKSEVKKALESQKAAKDRGQSAGLIGEILVANGVINDEQVAEILAKQMGFVPAKLDSREISPDVIKLLPSFAVKKYQAVPIEKENGRVTVAMSDPYDIDAVDNLRFILNTDLRIALATPKQIERAIFKYYDTSVDDMASAIQDTITREAATIDQEKLQVEDGVEQFDDDAPVIRFVQYVIREALNHRASDIHIEPFTNRIRIRYRIDGVCHEVDSPPKRLQGTLTSRIKIMAGMDIANKRVPQDGRIKVRLGGKEIDIRVSSLPSIYGESIVLRLLDRESIRVGIESLGFHPDDYKRFKRIISRPNGVFLVTGPTGSGKTTTLYAALNVLNRPDKKIITAEDPIEYNISGINQCQVHEKIDLTFTEILKTMLRQAPDVILVGEIRDQTTAKAAIEAALTGHLVFSTVHTNDAPSTITRLSDMGIKPFLISSSVQAIMAQRLVRVICDECKNKVEPDWRQALAVGVKREDLAGHTFYAGRDCEKCSNTGYYSRLGVFELLEMSATMREMTFRQATRDELRQQARNEGMVTLREDAVRKVFSGITTFEEVLRVTMGDLLIAA